MKKMKLLYSLALLIGGLSLQAQESFHVDVTGNGQSILVVFVSLAILIIVQISKELHILKNINRKMSGV